MSGKDEVDAAGRDPSGTRHGGTHYVGTPPVAVPAPTAEPSVEDGAAMTVTPIDEKPSKKKRSREE